ncbi:SMP-30/gluconolactonase/LRE family protein [Amycolatopsis taiwanensis]|uniref:Gluconolactonase n=1 Tax=Amycolatopsis taiwanensis TaxID=342230 RepID=A0A9W6VFK9_9PSEU|nr:SMP-30/gluconolactonase/LRE family protein [Amycolatopsis taiwanensis]GLY64974.1 gluconolactonase [Amycolatopsis taiwanensis]
MVWQPSERYPDPAVQVLDASFKRLRNWMAAIERLATGFRWAEGPVWFGDGRFLLWSDIPDNRILRWSEETGEVSVFRAPSDHANGNTRDRAGRLVTCEHSTRRVTRTEYDGEITVLADEFDGKRLNSPNDVVTKSDGSVWFSDPTYGITGNYLGRRAESELSTGIYRIDPDSGEIVLLDDALAGPNGLAFSPDESRLYVNDSGSRPCRIYAFDVADGGHALTNRRVLLEVEDGIPDGVRVDVQGNLWVAWGVTRTGNDGVRVINPDGRIIGIVGLPEGCANLCFGGRWRNRLFMAASQSLYSLYVNTQGVAGG